MNITHSDFAAKILSFVTRQTVRHNGGQRDAAAAVTIAAMQAHAMTSISAGIDREAATASFKEALEAYGMMYDGVAAKMKQMSH